MEQYRNAFKYVLEEYIPQNGYVLAGAAHEYYPVAGKNDPVDLYFPIEAL